MPDELDYQSAIAGRLEEQLTILRSAVQRQVDACPNCLGHGRVRVSSLAGIAWRECPVCLPLRRALARAR